MHGANMACVVTEKDTNRARMHAIGHVSTRNQKLQASTWLCG